MARKLASKGDQEAETSKGGQVEGWGMVIQRKLIHLDFIEDLYRFYDCNSSWVLLDSLRLRHPTKATPDMVRCAVALPLGVTCNSSPAEDRYQRGAAGAGGFKGPDRGSMPGRNRGGERGGLRICPSPLRLLTITPRRCVPSKPRGMRLSARHGTRGWHPPGILSGLLVISTPCRGAPATRRARRILDGWSVFSR